MTYLYIFGAAFAVYYFRRYWLTPWARYVSHSSTKRNDNFLTVKHVAWYPPFLDQEVTYHNFRGDWANVSTGNVPWGASYKHEFHQLALDGILQAAVARDIETEEILGGVK